MVLYLNDIRTRNTPYSVDEIDEKNDFIKKGRDQMSFHPITKQETNLNYDPVLRRWKAYSCVPRHLTKMVKMFGDPSKAEHDSTGKMISGTWNLASNQVSFRSGKPINRENVQKHAFFGFKKQGDIKPLPSDEASSNVHPVTEQTT
jgi:hypothetical protein